MRLTQAQFETVDRILKERGAGCPSCRAGTDSLAIATTLLAIPEFLDAKGREDAQVISATSASPFVPVTCQDCAHTFFFSALALGVVA